MATKRILYGDATPSDREFFDQDTTHFPSFPSLGSSNNLEMASEAESAPPDLSQLFGKLCEEYGRCIHEAGKVLPPEWNIPDLVRSVLGDQSIQHGFLNDAYYDLMLCGTRSWVCEELLNLIDLINYV